MASVNKGSIYICGDSICVPHIGFKNQHWSEQLARKVPEYNIKNLAFIGATNFSITAQIEKAIADPTTKFVIVNATDVYRIDVTSSNFKREVTVDNAVDEGVFFDFTKEQVKKIYVESYKNGFVSQENLLDIFSKNVYEDQRSDKLFRNNPKEKLVHFGIWGVSEGGRTIMHEKIKEKIPSDTLNTAKLYFKHIFNYTQRFYEDLAMIEGKLYKLHAKKIPFLYNLSGLTNKKENHYELFSDMIDKVSSIHGLENFHSDLNLHNIAEIVRREEKCDNEESPPYHFKSIKTHGEIANYYAQKIKEMIE
jgi:hypothetical protein